jgi:hypothetical protein
MIQNTFERKLASPLNQNHNVALAEAMVAGSSGGNNTHSSAKNIHMGQHHCTPRCKAKDYRVAGVHTRQTKIRIYSMGDSQIWLRSQVLKFPKRQCVHYHYLRSREVLFDKSYQRWNGR